MKKWMIILVGLTSTTIALGQGIVCVDPVTVTIEEKGTDANPYSAFSVSIDSLPAQTITTNLCGVFTNLDLKTDHMVKILRDGKPEASFKFNFQKEGSDHLRLWYRTQYGTWQLWKPGRRHECAYLKKQ